MTSLSQKINDLDLRIDNISKSGGGGTTDTTAIQAQVDTNTTDILGIQADKQDKLTPGDNISIVGNTISAIGGDVTQAELDTKQDILTAGDNISIVNNVISSSISHLFKITSTLNTNQSFSNGTIAQFNDIKFCLPITSAFNTGTYKYTVQKSGIYHISYSLYSNTAVSTQCRMAIVKNNLDIVIGGSNVANSTTTSCLEQCDEGDQLFVRCQIGSNVSLFMSDNYSFFNGMIMSRRHCKPIPTILPAILLEIIPIKIL
jgi:hypothetical protein